MFGSMQDTASLSQFAQNPVVSQMMQVLLSNPQYMNQILGLNPQQSNMLGSNSQQYRSCGLDTIIGFLLAGVGNVDLQRKTNYLIVDSKTTVKQIEEAFKEFTTREDVVIVMISQYVVNMIKFLVDSYNNPIPAILKIPSKDHPYDPTHDSVLSNLAVCDLSNLVKPQDIIITEHLTTLLAIVPKYSQKDWLSSYKTLTAYVIRDFEYNPETQESRKQELEKLMQDQETLRNSLCNGAMQLWGG